MRHGSFIFSGFQNICTRRADSMSKPSERSPGCRAQQREWAVFWEDGSPVILCGATFHSEPHEKLHSVSVLLSCHSSSSFPTFQCLLRLLSSVSLTLASNPGRHSSWFCPPTSFHKAWSAPSPDWLDSEELWEESPSENWSVIYWTMGLGIARCLLSRVRFMSPLSGSFLPAFLPWNL